MTNLIKALIKAQAALPAVTKDATNPHFKNAYASLEQVIDLTTPALRAQGLTIVQTFEVGPALRTTLYHESGEMVTGVQPLLMAKSDAQGLAGASTYARRYGILAILGIAAEDDDGETASRPSPPIGRVISPPALDRAELVTMATTLYNGLKNKGRDNEALTHWISGLDALTEKEIQNGITRMQAINNTK